jgi:hypothetical protein
MSDRELERRLRALRRSPAPPGLEARLMEGVPRGIRRSRTTGRAGRWWIMARVGLATGALATLIWGAYALLGPKTVGVSWAEKLEPVARASGETGAVRVVERVRSRPGEDFTDVELAGDLIRVEAWVRWPRGDGDPGRVRIEKPGLTYTFDGQEATWYRPDRREASRSPAQGFRMDLFWPEAWLRHLMAMPTDEAEVIANGEGSGGGRLALRWKGPDVKGRAPRFFEEFDREVEVTWDPLTRRLTGFSRWVTYQGRRVLYSELVSVDYPGDISEEVFRQQLPADVRWVKLSDAAAALNSLGPREVAETFWRAAIKGDWETVAVFCPSPSTIDWLKENRPLELLELGEPSRDGVYCGVYVPYKVRYAGPGTDGGGVPSPDGGVIRTSRLALRNDNSYKRWVEDGGI